MMKYVKVTCPHCDTATPYAIEDNESVVTCPACGQNNTNIQPSDILTGRCSKCTFPLDEHQWYQDFIVECPKKGVKP